MNLIKPSIEKYIKEDLKKKKKNYKNVRVINSFSSVYRIRL